MEQPVLFQVAQFAEAAAAGAALGLFYDLLRAVRWARPRLTRLCDALFCMVLLPSLLLLALYVGRGRFPLFFYPALGCGAWVCRRTVSKPVVGIVTSFFRLLR